MQVTIKIDSRENKLKNRLIDSIHNVSKTLEVKCDNLHCGDFIIEIDNHPLIVIERKSIADLVASIKDGRYKVQKNKMCASFSKHLIMYIIEGQLDYSQSDKPSDIMIEGMDKYSVVSSIVNTQIRDGVKVVNTKDVNDTHDFLLSLIVRIFKDPAKYIPNQANGDSSITCSKEDLITKNKIGNKEDLFFYQLTQVPGISAKTAQAFVVKFKTMQQLYEELTVLDDEQKLKILKNIMIEDSTKKRRISSKVAENVIKYMF